MRALATPSNCGEPLKLKLPSSVRKGAVARLTASGMVTTLEMPQWAIRSQVLRVRSVVPMDAVQRLNGGGSLDDEWLKI